MSSRTTRILLVIAAVLLAALLIAAALDDSPQKGPCDGVDHWGQVDGNVVMGIMPAVVVS